MALGANRDYKTHGRRVQTNLAKHWARWQELKAQGVPEAEASKQAMDEMLAKRRKKAEANLAKWRIDEESLILHPSSFQNNRDGSITIEARALVQIEDTDGSNWSGDEVISITLRKESK